MADNKTQIYRRINPYLSFSLKAFFALLIFLELHVDVLHVSATNQCTEFQFMVLNDADGTTLCVDCESCPPGQGLSHECGTEILSSEMVLCIPCIQDSSFSNNYDTSSCIQCSAPCSEDQLVDQNCTTTSDVKCAKQCNSKDRYYDEHTGDCQRCSKCCGDSQDVIEDECKRKMGAASNMICSIHSSVNRCDISTVTSTPSRQETMALQTDTDTKASPQDSTGSKIASTPASLKKTTESQNDVPRESPEVSTTFQSNLPHQNTGTVASFGETSFFEGSSKGKEADNQVDVPVIVGSTVAVVFMVLGLPLLALGYIRCYRSSRSRSGSVQAGSDAERGDNRGKKALKVIRWEKSQSDSSDPLCGKNAEELKCTCQEATKKDSKPLKSLLNEGSTFRAVCEMLNTKVANLGDYKDVAQYYGFDFYQIMSVLGQAACPGEPTRTRALIESLACSHPDETVEEFATVVEKEAKRKDVSGLLRAYDKAEEAIEELKRFLP